MIDDIVCGYSEDYTKLVKNVLYECKYEGCCPAKLDYGGAKFCKKELMKGNELRILETHYSINEEGKY
jgi:hypothetical protein